MPIFDTVNDKNTPWMPRGADGLSDSDSESDEEDIGHTEASAAATETEAVRPQASSIGTGDFTLDTIPIIAIENVGEAEFRNGVIEDRTLDPLGTPKLPSSGDWA